MALDPIKTLQAALRINRPAAVFLTGGFLVLGLAAVLASQLKESGLPFWQIPAALVGLSLVVAILAQMQRGVAVLVSWVLTVLFLLWAAAFTAQMISGNRLPIASAGCLLSFYRSNECHVSAAVVEAAPVAAVVGTAPVATVPAQPATPTADPGPIDRTGTQVYIQFTALPRDTVGALATALEAKGWGLQNGGEEYAHAAGLSEVRFFHPADKPRAQALAAEVSASLPGSPAVGVLDVTEGEYAQTRPGLLEVWISG
ncbi:hypothetical protein [Tabrizicola sp.]|uniref:hypothetical protein n=1 Tax=Tabrizicola sp. TaxID=2005166 RepID=UPI00286A83F3|nr:hypothetical protein [Tabrizicola sp.]